MVELSAPPVTAPLAVLDLGASLPGFTRDPDFDPVTMSSGAASPGATVVIRGRVDTEDAIGRIEQRPEVVRVWVEHRVDPFGRP
jgi:hypothetical protein